MSEWWQFDGRDDDEQDTEMAALEKQAFDAVQALNKHRDQQPDPRRISDDKKNKVMQTKQGHASWPVRYGVGQFAVHPDRRICGHRTNNPNRFGDHICTRAPIKGRTGCRRHGGTSPRGIASASYKGKGFSQDMPTHLLDRFMAAVYDPNMLLLDQEMALIDARVGELLSLLDSGESGALWRALHDAVDQLEQARLDGVQARRAGNQAAQDKAERVLAGRMNAVITRVQAGVDEAARFHEIYELFEQRGRLVGTAVKVRREMKTSITTEQMLLMLHRVSDIVLQHVTDKDMLAAIARDITALTTRDNIPRR
jgi:hypothetical protein